ncbi:MAG: hypothetical protein RIQ60_1547 [Pseudomonadota bacterium]|jgi:hypothetical protein
MPRPAPSFELRAPDEAWPSRAQLLSRQQELIRRSAELRGELTSELRAGWQLVATPIDLALRLRDLLADVHRRMADLRSRYPRLAATLLLWQALSRLVWRRLRRRKTRGLAREVDDAGRRRAGRWVQLLRVLRWARWAVQAARLLSGTASTSSR